MYMTTYRLPPTQQYLAKPQGNLTGLIAFHVFMQMSELDAAWPRAEVHHQEQDFHRLYLFGIPQICCSS